MTVTRNILEKCLLQAALDEIKEIEAVNYEIEASASFKKRIEKAVAKGKRKTYSYSHCRGDTKLFCYVCRFSGNKRGCIRLFCFHI